ncbi:hypothetical protein BRADI_3g14654v3 [Brachypodium distachyon]|uniref:Uncharacterized protein n=1 Tax=Brachypodium distachyon TaxID=15368 RepID=A0A2K2CX48_BRADI|nr:hypothetical protein BRADI_3g14654v3 [Brachypodium distachyon]
MSAGKDVWASLTGVKALGISINLEKDHQTQPTLIRSEMLGYCLDPLTCGTRLLVPDSGASASVTVSSLVPMNIMVKRHHGELAAEFGMGGQRGTADTS